MGDPCRDARTPTKLHGKLDLLEVYASPDSKLTHAVNQLGGKAVRYTFSHGDLSTPQGQRGLLHLIARTRPRHVWMAPECSAWCSWSRFNQGRSLSSHDRISQLREASRVHLRLCRVIMKIQLNAGRHFHMENPGSSEMWQQPEVDEICQRTMPAYFDQCRFGLRHPQSRDRFMRKTTRIQTSSLILMERLDGQFCRKDHEHTPIAGSCKTSSGRLQLSRYAAFYPKSLAQAIAKQIVFHQDQPVDTVLTHVDLSDAELHEACPVDALEPPSKRAKATIVPNSESRDTSEQPQRLDREREEAARDDTPDAKRARNRDMTEERQDEVEEPLIHDAFNQLQKMLPKSGARSFDADNSIVQQLQAVFTDMTIREMKACKGVERYLTGSLEHPLRRTLVQSRLDRSQVVDLGMERWRDLPKLKRTRKAIPSHIMVCLFGHPKETSDLTAENPKTTIPVALDERLTRKTQIYGKSSALFLSKPPKKASCWECTKS